MADPRKDALERAQQFSKGRRQGQELPPFPEEMFSKFVPTADRRSGGFETPFGREFDFTGVDEAERSATAGKTGEQGTVEQRRQKFLDAYFPGESGEVINPSTGRPYGKELYLHDALHQYANIGSSLRQEEALTLAEKVGTARFGPLGVSGLTQQPDVNDSFDPASAEAAVDNASTFGMRWFRDLTQDRLQPRGSSLFRDRNSVSSFLSPAFTNDEIGELKKRGLEFYDQVHQGFNDWKQSPEGQKALKAVERNPFGSALVSQAFIDQAAPKLQIEGGYSGPNKLPYGPIEQFMNAPLAPVVDADAFERAVVKRIEKQAGLDHAAIQAEATRRRSPEFNAERMAFESAMDDRRTLVSIIASSRDPEDMAAVYGVEPDSKLGQWTRAYKRERGGDWETVGGKLERIAGPEPEDPAKGASTVTERFRGLDDMNERETLGQVAAKSRDEIAWQLEDTLRNEHRRVHRSGPGAGLAPKDGVLHLNPPNLGLGLGSPGENLPVSTAQAKDWLTGAAAEARDFGRVKGAVAVGSRAAVDMASSVPLADPEFQQAIERQDLGKAAGIVGRDYAIGTATAPVVGMGAGVLQRMAPAAAARVLPAVAAAGRLSNPVIAVSQLGGDQRQNARMRAAAFKANPAASGGMGPSADPQLLRAEAARRRGGKWGVNTPFGRVNLPELGLSEAGGLFFR